MKLFKSDLEKRVKISLNKTVKADGVNGIMEFGVKNDYPDTVELLVNGSKTAKSASKVYSQFLSGQGFENEAINDVIIGHDYRGKKITIKTLLQDAANSCAVNNGFYFKLNISLDRKIKGVYLIPFKYCRFAKIDDLGYTAKIGVHPNWSNDNDEKKFKKNEVVWYNVFNLNEDAFNAQIKLDENGEIQNFNGQIYFEFLDNQYIYPLSPFDPVYLDLDTENQLSMFMNNTTRNGMLQKTVLTILQPDTEEDEIELDKSIENFLGVDGDSTLILKDKLNPDTGELLSKGSFEASTIPTSVNDALFSEWHKTLSNNIRKVISAMPTVLIDYEESKLGTTSGEAIIQATNFFNSMTKQARYQIEKSFAEIFQYSDNPVLAQNQNWKIKELSLYENKTTQLAVNL